MLTICSMTSLPSNFSKFAVFTVCTLVFVFICLPLAMDGFVITRTVQAYCGGFIIQWAVFGTRLVTDTLAFETLNYMEVIIYKM